MFGRRILGGAPDSFRVSMGHEVAGPEVITTPTTANNNKAPLKGGKDGVPASLQGDTQESWEERNDETHVEITEVDWTSDDPDPVAVSRLKKATEVKGILREKVSVRIAPVQAGNMINAATWLKDVQVSLDILQIPPQLRQLEFSRITPSGTPQLTLLTTLIRECELEGVSRIACVEGMVPLWEESIISRLHSLKSLHLNGCNLTTIPSEIGALANLRELRISSNKLTALPHELGSLTSLRRLVADNNLITAVPVELRYCSELRQISLENNRLATPVMDLRAVSHLESLQLFGNPLEFLPELSPCTGLRSLSLANVRLHCDEAWSAWDVEVTPLSQSYMGRGQPHKLALLFGLIFRRSSCQHPLLAGALGKIAEDPLNCAIIATEVGAIQQLILMALSDNEVVVEQACKTIGLLGKHNSITMNEIIDRNVLATMVRLITSLKHKNQLAGLGVISGLAVSSEAAAKKLLTPDLLVGLTDLVRSGADDVKAASLETLGNLAFARPNKVTFLQTPGLVSWLARLAKGQVGGVSLRSVQITATRALAILGENELVRQAVGRHPIVGRGLRILSMDGGGMKGIAIVRQLRQLEERTGRRIHELFDLICGTSTGGILAVALALKQFTLLECEQIYRNLGQRVFLRPGGTAREEDGWRDSLYRVYKSGQQSMRVAVYGCKHDAAMFELLLKEYCIFDQPGLSGNAMIDTACLGTPKCFVVSTWASMTPAEPFLFRNYEYPLSATKLAKKVKCVPGSSCHQVWQAVRASSAAPYYLDDFKCGNDRFQDGAAIANNPAALAVQQARILWPDQQLECLVSIGSGTVPIHRREKSMSSYMDTGNVLIESACSVDRVDSALATLAPLIPGFSYFRFCPSDMRCGIELDEIDPAKWKLLEDATDEFIVREDALFDSCARLLVHNMVEAVPKRFDIASLALGATRGVAVIEVPRAGRHATGQAMNHVEAVSRMAAALPQCVAYRQLGVSPNEDVESEASGSGRAIAALVEQCNGAAGVVHLGLHGNKTGLITSWRRQLESVPEPSAAAELLLLESASDFASLSELAKAQPGFEAGDNSWIQMLSQQTNLSQQPPLCSYLFQRTKPQHYLTPADVGRMLGCWDGNIVATSSHMPTGLAKALLENGARAVICRQAAAESSEGPESISKFFAELYRVLLAGFPVVKALALAGKEVPSLQNAYVCCIFNANGELTVAESSPKEDEPPEDAESEQIPNGEAGHISLPKTPQNQPIQKPTRPSRSE